MKFIPPATQKRLDSVWEEGTRHANLLAVAVSLVGEQWGFEEVFHVLRSKLANDPDKTDKEIRDAIIAASNLHPTPCSKSNKFLPVANSIKIKKPKEVVSQFLGHTNPRGIVTEQVDPVLIFSLYDPEDFINVVTTYQVTTKKNGRNGTCPIGGGVTRKAKDWIEIFSEAIPSSEAGAWVRPNPCSEFGSGNLGAYKDADILRPMFSLVEFDSITIEEQLDLYRRFRLPIAAIIRSGGKSVHAWVRVSAQDKEEFDFITTELYKILSPFGIDESNRNISRFSRLPGALRKIGSTSEAGDVQELIFLNPDVEPLTESGLEIFKESLIPLPFSGHKPSDLFRDALDRYDYAAAHKYEVGVLTGFSEFDTKTGGLKPGSLTVLGAETNGGKTTFALNVMMNALRQNKKVALFSLEMTKEEIIDLMVVMEGRVNRNNLNTGDFQLRDFPAIMGALGRLRNNNLTIFDHPDPLASEIRTCAKKLKIEEGLDFVIVDYLQLVQAINPKESREQQVAQVGRSMRYMAKELHIPVLALSQLNEEGRFRESRTIGHEASASLIMKEPEGGGTVREVAVVKGRSIPKFTFKVRFEAEYSIMRDSNPMQP